MVAPTVARAEMYPLASVTIELRHYRSGEDFDVPHAPRKLIEPVRELPQLCARHVETGSIGK